MKTILLILFGLLVLGALLWVFGPREPVGRASFAPSDIGADLDAYLAESEAQVANMRPGTEKRILWAEKGAKTPYSVVYLHGFSASALEISPVPERVAEALGANLFFTRFTGHGRDGPAMAEGSLPEWRRDAAEALEIGARLGERVLVIATSTGAPLLTLEMGEADVAGVVLVSPN
ncbi:MAG: alpha/beta hydrolase, partial [Pseudomonadota bacterium]